MLVGVVVEAAAAAAAADVPLTIMNLSFWTPHPIFELRDFPFWETARVVYSGVSLSRN